ncbi:unnamed protein product, partial [Adineta steineri]
FSSRYVVRLSGIMRTIAGSIIFIDFALIKLADDITEA